MGNSEGRWVLVTDGGHGGSRDCVAAVRGLAEGGYQVAVTVSPGSSRAAPSRFAKRRVRTPRADEGGFLEAIQAETALHDYLTVLPASEGALLALGVATPHLTDKEKLERAAAGAGLSVPASRLVTSTDDLAERALEVGYPLAAKPVLRTASAARIDSPVHLHRLAEMGRPLVLQSWVNEGLHEVSGVMWKGRLVAATHDRWLRIWPPQCGLASAAITTEPDRDLEDRLVKLLGDYEGVFGAQFAGPHLIDLNLRVGSLHSLSIAAGVNPVSIYCRLLEGKSVDTVRGRPGRYYRWLEGDLRHLTHAVREHETSASTALGQLRPRRGTAHSIESLRDPAPLLARLVYGASRVHRPAHERAKGSVH
jgi:predicted ATP-grasp superfamily ATP-dependent carboligase